MFHATPQGLSKVYVGNLPWGATEDSLRTAFSKWGPLQDVFIVRDRLSGRSKGFGFITYETSESAEDAVKNMNEAVFEGRNLRVNNATEKPPRTDFNKGY